MITTAITTSVAGPKPTVPAACRCQVRTYFVSAFIHRNMAPDDGYLSGSSSSTLRISSKSLTLELESHLVSVLHQSKRLLRHALPLVTHHTHARTLLVNLLRAQPIPIRAKQAAVLSPNAAQLVPT